MKIIEYKSSTSVIIENVLQKVQFTLLVRVDKSTTEE